MSTFERYLSLWVAVCIVLGIGMGHLYPGGFRAVGALEVARVNLPKTGRGVGTRRESRCR